MTSPTRPALRYLGGKWRLAPWIIGQFPRHRVYVEPFCGAASVLLRKPRSQGECVNDLSGDIVGLFRVLRDPDNCAALIRLIEATAYAREEYDAAFEASDCPVESAWRLVVRSYMGHGSSAAVAVRSTGFRASLVNRDGALPANDWATLPQGLAALHARLQGVVIEHRDARAVMERYAAADTLLYLDPPYLPDTRSQKRKAGGLFHAYAHELSTDDHIGLLLHLRSLPGMIAVSGYPSPVYDDLLEGWTRLEKQAHADGALKRTEILWLNPAATAARGAA